MRHLLCLLVCTLFLLAPARAEDFQVDGLDADSTAYASALRARNPAGLTPQNRRQMEQRATDAQRRNDWAGVASVLEAFAGTGNPPSDAWLALARAQLRRTPPTPPTPRRQPGARSRPLRPGQERFLRCSCWPRRCASWTAPT